MPARNGAKKEFHRSRTVNRAKSRTVVVVGLLQLSAGSSLRGSTFIELSRALAALELPGKDQTTVDLYLAGLAGGSARDACKIALLLRSVASTSGGDPGLRQVGGDPAEPCRR